MARMFADEAKKIMDKYSLRPDDNASKKSMELELKVLEEEQEAERARMAQEAFNTLDSLGYSQPGMMGDRMPMHQMPDGSMMPGAQHGQQEYATGGFMDPTIDPEHLKTYKAQLRMQENAQQKGLNPNTGKWMPYTAYEDAGKANPTYDIGYGVKLPKDKMVTIDGKKIDASKGLTDEQMESLFTSKIKSHEDVARKQWNKRYSSGTKYDDLSQDMQVLVTDFAYNLGDINKFPSLMNALQNNDVEEAYKQYKRYSGGKEMTSRNQWTKQQLDKVFKQPYPKAYGGNMNMYATGGPLDGNEETVTPAPRTPHKWEMYNPSNLQAKVDELNAKFTNPYTGKKLTETQNPDAVMDIWNESLGLSYNVGDSTNTSSLFYERAPKGSDEKYLLDKDGNPKVMKNPAKNVPWSAATVSDLVLALYGQDRKSIRDIGFRTASSHSSYVKDAFKSEANPDHKYDLYQPSRFEDVQEEFEIGDILFKGREEYSGGKRVGPGTSKWTYDDFAKAAKNDKSFISHTDIITDKGSDKYGSYYVVSGGNTSDEASGVKGDTFGQKKIYYDPETGKIKGKRDGDKFNNYFKGAMRIKETRRPQELKAAPQMQPQLVEGARPGVVPTPLNVYMQEHQTIDPIMRQAAGYAYGGNMRKKYVHGGPHGDDEITTVPTYEQQMKNLMAMNNVPYFPIGMLSSSEPSMQSMPIKPNLLPQTEGTLATNYGPEPSPQPIEENIASAEIVGKKPDSLYAPIKSGILPSVEGELATNYGPEPIIPPNTTDRPEYQPMNPYVRAAQSIAPAMSLAYSLKKPEERDYRTMEYRDLDPTIAKNEARKASAEAYLRGRGLDQSDKIAFRSDLASKTGSTLAGIETQYDQLNRAGRMAADEFNIPIEIQEDEMNRRAQDQRMQNIIGSTDELISKGFVEPEIDKQRYTRQDQMIQNLMTSGNYEFIPDGLGGYKIVPKTA